MKKWYKIIFALCLFTLATNSAIAQEITITGTVLDENMVPLIGVTVAVPGTCNGVMTDSDGKYTIKAHPKANLEFRMIGYVTQVIPVDNRTAINVLLQPAPSNFNAYNPFIKKDRPRQEAICPKQNLFEPEWEECA